MTAITNPIIINYYNDICSRWNYVPSERMSTGYEAFMPRLRQLSKEVWSAADDAGKQQIEDEVFNIYRSTGIIPVHYYNLDGCRDQILELSTKSKKIEDRILGVGNNEGLTFGRFWFENMQDAYTRNNKDVSLRARFNNDKKLKRAINLCYKHRDEGADAVIPKNLRRAFDLVSGGSIQNFKPMNARAVWEYICPVMWGRVLDFSSGYGGRMLGAMTSNMRYHYTGIDPNTKTYNGLVALGELINECNLGSGYEMNHLPSEDFDPEPESYDAAFSSPPYFNLETYSDEETQCMNRCSNLDAWFEFYVEPTLKMIHKGLAPGALYAVNIADYNFDKENFQIVERWKELSEKVGFKFEHTVKMMLNVRPGQGNNRQQNALKFEGIYIFSKK
jgi:hypothetical protein